MSNTNNDFYTVDQSNGASDNDQNLNGASLGQLGGVQIATVDQSIDSGSNDQSNKSSIFDFGNPTSSSNAQNDHYGVDQSNNLFDSDSNKNVFDVQQSGGANVVFSSQDITSGYNNQDNHSKIFDSGVTGSHSNNASNDTYDVTQFNGMRDEDTNGNALHLTQDSPGPWTADLAFASQSTTSGGNSQENNSHIFDTGYSDGSGGGGGGWGVFSFGGGHGGGGGGDTTNTNNDSYVVDQSNMMLDNDTNYNLADVSQTGTANIVFLNQDITSGGNSQENNSHIFDTGYSDGSGGGGGWGAFSFGGGHGGGSGGASNTNNDTYDVGQENQMSDNDQNANSLDLSQMFAVNINGVDQSTSSGGNSQENNSHIFDNGIATGGGGGGGGLDIFSFGGGHGGGGGGGDTGGNSNNDDYTVGQSNMMFDNDINLNIGIVAQVGFGNVAGIDQSIDSGGNTQTNNSGIFDFGLAGSHSNNDTYDLTQSNMLSDNDANQNLASVEQLVGAPNLADFHQDVDAGHNDGSNSSHLFDLGL